MDDNLAFPLTRTPLEVTELILGRVESRRDLVSFAAASTACKELVIPRHTEYRTLRVGHAPEIWAHLAQRPDLARNIRHVTIRGAPSLKIYSKPERYPVTLVDAAASAADEPDTVIGNICEALRSMKFLRSFTWIAAWSPMGPYLDFPHYYSDIFQVLKESKSLVQFKMVDKMVPGTLARPAEEEEYPLWHIANLESLSVRQLGWWPRGLNLLLCSSPNLQTLDIRLPKDGSHVFTSCLFPQLHRLNLNSTGRSSEQEIVEFLQKHPSIEDLRWYPHNDTLRLGYGSLPNLKCLITSPGIACAVLADPTVPSRAIECVSQLSLDDSTLAILDAIDTSQLRDIRVWRYAGLESIDHLAELFPNLTHLEIPNFGIPTRQDENNNYVIDDYILTLAKFRHLEYLIDSAIWAMLLIGGEASDKIATLAARCPSLQRLGYFNTQKSEYVDIVLCREGGKVSWSEEMAEKEWHGI
ncbi:hypothetical protein B0H14DRAFT_2792829 [Mycena olivaceomarginata]|nr:hypothetical protein B0H14DRAFT_2792829 [Mycena olivaceomarginata]